MVFICFSYTFYIHPIHIEGQDEGQKVATRKVEDGQKTLFPRIVQGPLGCHLLSSLVPKSRFRGSGKKFFSSCKMRFKMMQNYPLSIFHASVRPESLPGADFSTFQKIIFSLFSSLFGPFRARYFLKKGFQYWHCKVSLLEEEKFETECETKLISIIGATFWQFFKQACSK